MKRADIIVGRDYAMLVSGRVVRVTVLREWNDTHWRTYRRVVRWTVRNLASGRLLENVGAGRFRAAWDESAHGPGPVASGREFHASERARAEREAERERAAIAGRDAERRARNGSTLPPAGADDLADPVRYSTELEDARAAALAKRAAES